MKNKIIIRTVEIISYLILLGFGSSVFAHDFPPGDRTPDDLVTFAKQHVIAIEADAVLSSIQNNSNTKIIDVRTSEEFAQSHLPGAINIPRGLLEFKIGSSNINTNDFIIVYCKTGGRSALAALVLKEMGYGKVRYMNGGFYSYAMKMRNNILVPYHAVYNNLGKLKYLEFRRDNPDMPEW